MEKLNPTYTGEQIRIQWGKEEGRSGGARKSEINCKSEKELEEGEEGERCVRKYVCTYVRMR